MRQPLRLFLTTMALLTTIGPAIAETDQEVAGREAALELAGAFSNDGFKLRDGHWSGMLTPNESTLVAVNLYAGNDYWFSAGATEKAKKISVSVFDDQGALVPTEKYTSGAKAAAGFTVNSSGQYYVQVRLDAGEPAGVCLVYSYK
jgi:hypothetical protein